MTDADRAPEIAAVVAGVVRQAVDDAGAAGIVLHGAPSPEAMLLQEWCRDMLLEDERADGLAAHPANKTALLLAGRTPPEPLLPLGDVYASQVERLAGGWTAPPAVRELAERAGGIVPLDRALIALIDERRGAETALASLPAAVRPDILDALERGRFARRRIGLVPKLGARTLGIDLFA